MTKKIFSYCSNCISAQYFIKVNDEYVCEECGKPLHSARYYGTIVTLDREYHRTIALSQYEQ